MHALEAVPQREQVGRDRPQVVTPEKGVYLLGIQRIGVLGRHDRVDV